MTHNKLDDVLSDWQPLHDVSAPKAHALASNAQPRTLARLRFTTSDDTGRTAVYILVDEGRHLIDYRRDTERRRVAGHVYSVGRPAPSRLSAKARLCISAYDPSGNESQDCCAPNSTSFQSRPALARCPPLVGGQRHAVAKLDPAHDLLAVALARQPIAQGRYQAMY